MRKRSRSSINKYSIALLILVILGAASFFIFWPHNKKADAPARSSAPAPIASMFSFTGSGKWWQGATNETSMALFNYDRANTASQQDTCFTSVEYKAGTVNAAAELKAIEDGIRKGGYSVTPIATQTLTIKTPTGPVSYELHQSEVVTPAGAEKLQGGQEHGYAQLAGGYIKVMGYCNTPAQLPDTLPALQAISIKRT